MMSTNDALIQHMLDFYPSMRDPVLLIEVEAIVNTRPMTYIFEDFNSRFVLTPSHFLLGKYNNANPFNTEDNVGDDGYVPNLDSTQSLLH